MARYIINRDNRTIHDSEHLNEKCNTDQIVHRRSTDVPFTWYHKCEHCMPEKFEPAEETIIDQVEKLGDELEEEFKP